MAISEMIATQALQTEKSIRGEEIRCLTSGRAGYILPLAFIPMLRMDRVSRGHVRIALEMSETIRPLMNSVNVTAYAHVIPFLAFDRFSGMESLNRSYQGVPEPLNGQVVPFFKTLNFDNAAPFWKTLGVHWKQGSPINDAPVEAYNLLVNWRRRARSEKLPQRALNDTSLAPAFWRHTAFSQVVPDFDQAAIDGEVSLQFVASKLPVYARANPVLTYSGQNYRVPSMAAGAAPAPLRNFDGVDFANFGGQIFAELKDSGAKVSLANIELAKKTAAFAKLREKYDGLDEDHIIDLLMEGIDVPPEAQKQPILLDYSGTVFGMSERHAMDGPNLAKSVTTGSTELTLNLRTPPLNTGGIILITLEIVPEQLFERQWDQFLGTSDPARLPNFMRDFLDPEKVEVVPNKVADVLHSAPEGVFGYQPLNVGWRRSLTRIGGRYYRKDVDAFTEDRQRFWSVEQLNPTLTSDFYLVNNLPHTVFADMAADPFEAVTLGAVQIVGNTVFGQTLTEDGQNYDEIMAQVDTSRIQQP